MKYVIALLALTLLAGCYAPLKVSVYGKSGTPFTAPSLCAALVQCLNSKEASCFYDRDLVSTASGAQAEEECKEVAK
ncbi:MAG: hypothetical protein ACLQLH_17355 [Terracidiphilus sp.]